MAEEQNNPEFGAEAAAAEGQQGGQFQLQKLYLKDSSFEVPHAPQVYQEPAGQLELKLNIQQKAEVLAENQYEVTLTITVTAVLGEKTIYLCEVHQSGIFLIDGFPEAQRNAVINILCPTTLYPYARAQITQLVAAGGFPPVVLQPISFDQIYAQRLQQQQQEAAQSA
ncbi:MAG: protein-export chaperone SecB [Xanthomonadales bacterium]|nr:protein-export chaperone SecB [Xanthomonadales bacterium]